MASIDSSRITHVAFDADDTLWANENIFVDAQETCESLLRPYLDSSINLNNALYEFERKNLAIFGYGIKGFMLSMIETAIELSGGAVSGKEIQRIIDVGKEMLQHPVELLPHVVEAIDVLEDRFPLMIITKGDLFDQENKIARSGVGHHFQIVEIVSEKTPAAYQDICNRHNLDPAGLLMLGNSLKSDILPILEIGGQAIHVPYQHTWVHERVADDIEQPGFARVDKLSAAVELIIPTV